MFLVYQHKPLDHFGNTDEYCSAEEFTTGDNNVPVCQDFADDNWESEFISVETNS